VSPVHRQLFRNRRYPATVTAPQWYGASPLALKLNAPLLIAASCRMSSGESDRGMIRTVENVAEPPLPGEVGRLD